MQNPAPKEAEAEIQINGNSSVYLECTRKLAQSPPADEPVVSFQVEELKRTFADSYETLVCFGSAGMRVVFTLRQILVDRHYAAERAFAHFMESDEAKHPKAPECLAKDRDVLLTFYDFPGEHWIHLRTTNPIESTFATVRQRTAKTLDTQTRDPMLTMVFKTIDVCTKRWRRLNRPERLGEVIQGIKFNAGIKQEEAA